METTDEYKRMLSDNTFTSYYNSVIPIEFFFNINDSKYLINSGWQELPFNTWALLKHFTYPRDTYAGNTRTTTTRYCKFEGEGDHCCNCKFKLRAVTYVPLGENDDQNVQEVYDESSESCSSMGGVNEKTVYHLKGFHNHEFDQNIVKDGELRDLHDELNQFIKNKLLKLQSNCGDILLSVREHSQFKESIFSDQVIRKKITRFKGVVHTRDTQLTKLIVEDILKQIPISNVTTYTDFNDEKFNVFVGFDQNIALLANNFTLHADTAFNIFIANIEMKICGLSDATSKFHPLALLICNNENTESYNILFFKFKEMYANKTSAQLRIQATVTDWGTALLYSLNLHFPDVPRKRCWFHLKQNIQSQIKLLDRNSKELVEQLGKDIAYLHRIISYDKFVVFSKIFRDFWEDKVTPTSKVWLISNLIDQHNWIECVSVFAPATNNALESTNGHLKHHICKSGKVTFKIGLLKTVKYFKRFLENHTFAQEPLYTQEYLTTAQRNIIKKELNNQIIWMYAYDEGLTDADYVLIAQLSAISRPLKLGATLTYLLKL